MLKKCCFFYLYHREVKNKRSIFIDKTEIAVGDAYLDELDKIVF